MNQPDESAVRSLVSHISGIARPLRGANPSRQELDKAADFIENALNEFRSLDVLIEAEMPLESRLDKIESRLDSLEGRRRR